MRIVTESDRLLESHSALLGTGLEVDRTDDTEDYLSSLCLAETSDLRDREQWHLALPGRAEGSPL